MARAAQVESPEDEQKNDCLKKFEDQLEILESTRSCGRARALDQPAGVPDMER